MSTESTAEVRPPSPWLLLAEGGRAPWEYAATLAAMPWLNRVPPGDGPPVVVGTVPQARCVEVVRQIPQMRLGHPGIPALDCLGHRAMQHLTLPGKQIVVERLTSERVAEGEALGRLLDDQLGSHQFLDRSEQGPFVVASDGAQN